MPWKFNPFSNTLDQTGSGGGGGGSAFFTGEVATYANLPLDGTAPLDSRWLVRTNSGTWPFSTYKQAGVYVRSATVGANRDDDYTLTDTSFHDVMSDDAFVLFDEGDATKNLKFQLSGLTTGTVRTITVPDKSLTLDDSGDTRDPNAHAASHAAGGSDPIFEAVPLFEGQTDGATLLGSLSVSGNSTFYTSLSVFGASTYYGGIQLLEPLSFDVSVGNPEAPAITRTNLGLGDAATADIGTGAGDVCAGDDARLSDARTPTSHTHGSITNDGKLGSTSGLPVVTTTAGAVTTLELGTAGQVLQVNSGATGVEFAAASGGGVTGASSSASDVLGVSGSDITGVDATADRIVFWDDSESALKYLATVGPTFDGTTLRWPVELIIACSDETTDLTTGTAKVTFRAPYAFLLTGVRASVNTAPTGSTLIVDINNGANSALSTKLSIDASEKTSTTAATAAVIDTDYDDISDDAELTIDIDQIGSTIAGKGLKVVLIGTRA